MADDANSIGVITVTRGRVRLLRRAMASVRSQSAAAVHHHIVVDDCLETATMLHSCVHAGTCPKVEWVLVGRPPKAASGPSRVSRLRNLMAGLCEEEWLAFLDDDNEFEVDHLARLLAECQAAGTPAAHSHRQILNEDGSPYLAPRCWWSRDTGRAETLYRELVDIGVLTEGSNVCRSRADPVLGGLVIDTSELFIRRDLFLQHPFAEDYTSDDWDRELYEDDKIVMDMLAAGIRIACTDRPTLRYYLGGYSNAHTEIPASDRWLRP